MPVLQDHLRPGLTVVFCGTAVAKDSAERGHYYCGPGNQFWQFLFESGLTPVQISPEDDHTICEYDLGLTDLAKEVVASSDKGLKPHYRIQDFVSKIERIEPLWIGFHGKEAAKEVARHLRMPRNVRLGKQAWQVGSSSVFVLPSASGANRDVARLEGKSSRQEWFRELAQACRVKRL